MRHHVFRVDPYYVLGTTVLNDITEQSLALFVTAILETISYQGNPDLLSLTWMTWGKGDPSDPDIRIDLMVLLLLHIFTQVKIYT